jgi:hypothetical protein
MNNRNKTQERGKTKRSKKTSYRNDLWKVMTMTTNYMGKDGGMEEHEREQKEQYKKGTDHHDYFVSTGTGGSDNDGGIHQE